MMAKTYLFLLFALATLSVLANDSKIIAQSPGSITFEVDENLPFINHQFDLGDGEQTAALIFEEYKELLNAYGIVASSFADEHNLEYVGDSPFYETLMTAYAKHKSVTLSPDMVWLLISQGFARYVDAHAEELRSLFVDHTGKMTLNVLADKELLKDGADWPKLIGGFATQIDQFTKGDIAQVITADFSTTGPVERVATQITLMKSVEHYFDYEVWYTTCGIPSIALKGTPEDWQRVLDKTKKLSQYGLEKWVKELEPILTEFIRTAEGHPNQKFWKSIVKKVRVDVIVAPGEGCGDMTEPTTFDGWFLKFFPDENGKTREIAALEALESERVFVPFLYQIKDETGTLLLECPMELWAGFIGIEVDTAANMLTPKIGWMALKGQSVIPKNSKAYLYAVNTHRGLSLGLLVLAVLIFGLLGRKIIKSRKKGK
jgi:hypothetical protein